MKIIDSYGIFCSTNKTIQIWTIKIDLSIWILLSIILCKFQNTLTSMVKARLRRGGKRQQGNGQWLGWTLQKSVCFTSFTVSVEKKITTFAAAATFQANYCLDFQKFTLNRVNPIPTNCCHVTLIYSRVRNKHSRMLINFLTFIQGLRPYSGLHSIR